MSPLAIFGIAGTTVCEIVSGAMLVSLFWIALRHPERIGKTKMFRATIWLFLISLILPAISRAMTTYASYGVDHRTNQKFMWMAQIVLAVSPVVCIVGFLLAIELVVPRQNQSIK